MPRADSIPARQRATASRPGVVGRVRPEPVGDALVGAGALPHGGGRAGGGEGVGHVLAHGLRQAVAVPLGERAADARQPRPEALAREQLLVGPHRGVEAHAGRGGPAGGGRVVVADRADQRARHLGHRPPCPLGSRPERRQQPVRQPGGRGDRVVEKAVGHLPRQPCHARQHGREPDRDGGPGCPVGAAQAPHVHVVELPGRPRVAALGERGRELAHGRHHLAHPAHRGVVGPGVPGLVQAPHPGAEAQHEPPSRQLVQVQGLAGP